MVRRGAKGKTAGGKKGKAGTKLEEKAKTRGGDGLKKTKGKVAEVKKIGAGVSKGEGSGRGGRGRRKLSPATQRVAEEHCSPRRSARIYDRGQKVANKSAPMEVEVDSDGGPGRSNPPKLTQSHVNEVLEPPQLDVGGPQTTSKRNDNEPQPSTSRAALTDVGQSSKMLSDQDPAFFQECVTDWAYYGFATKADFTSPAIQTALRRRMWHEIRIMCGHLINVVSKLVVAPDGSAQGLEFKISNFFIKRGRVHHEDLAVTYVAIGPNGKLKFVFRLTDVQRASEWKINVGVLKRACERVLDSVVFRCLSEDGAEELAC